MCITDLPLELFHEILHRSIETRGLKRGLRLRLVNKLFAKETIQAIFVFQLLEDYLSTKCDRDFVLPAFAAAYLERRIINEPLGGIPSLVQIRRVAQRLCLESEDGRSVQDYIKELSPVVIKNSSGRTDWLWKADKTVKYEDELEADVYNAALYTNNITSAEKCLAYGNMTYCFSGLFGSPSSHVAAFGDRRAFAALMSQNSDQGPHSTHQLRLATLRRVAEAGRAEMIQFVFDFNAERDPLLFSNNKRPSHRSYAWDNNWQLATLAHTPSKPVFEILMRLRRMYCISKTGGSWEYGPKEWTDFLAHCVLEGWADMAEHYISLGASVDALGPALRHWNRQQRMILYACECGHEDVVAVLLKHGADTSTPALEVAARHGHLSLVSMLLDHGAELGKAVYEAVAKGYKDIVAKLLSHGAVIKGDQRSLLPHAVAREDKAMFRLLVEGGCDLTDQIAMNECLQLAKREGLDSMIDFLRQMEAPTLQQGICSLSL